MLTSHRYMEVNIYGAIWSLIRLLHAGNMNPQDENIVIKYHLFRDIYTQYNGL